MCMTTRRSEPDKTTSLDNERKQHFLQHKEKHKDTKEAYTDGHEEK